MPVSMFAYTGKACQRYSGQGSMFCAQHPGAPHESLHSVGPGVVVFMAGGAAPARRPSATLAASCALRTELQ